MSIIAFNFLIVRKKDCGCPGTGLPEETGQYLTAYKEKSGSSMQISVPPKTGILLIKALLRVSNGGVALQLHRMKFTKSAFANGKINPSPNPTASNKETYTFTREEERKRRKEKIRGKKREKE